MTRLKVVQLCRYPVKSMAGERVSATASTRPALKATAGGAWSIVQPAGC